MRFRKEEDGYLITFQVDEKIEESLVELAGRERIEAAHFWGIGAVRDIILGYYDLKDKTYRKSEFGGFRELVSLTGSLARTDEGLILHMHGVFSDADFRTLGGHVFSLTSAATVELYLVPLGRGLTRKYDGLTGLKLLDI